MIATVSTLFVVPVMYALLRKDAPIGYDKSIEDEEHEGEKKDGEKKEGKDGAAPTLWIIGALILAVLLLTFFVGYLPQHRRERALQEEASAEAKALPSLTFVMAKSPPEADLFLPGNIEAITEAPILV